MCKTTNASYIGIGIILDELIGERWWRSRLNLTMEWSSKYTLSWAKLCLLGRVDIEVTIMGWGGGGVGEWAECYSLGPGFISLLGSAEMSFSWNIEWATSGGIYQSPQKVLES